MRLPELSNFVCLPSKAGGSPVFTSAVISVAYYTTLSALWSRLPSILVIGASISSIRFVRFCERELCVVSSLSFPDV